MYLSGPPPLPESPAEQRELDEIARILDTLRASASRRTPGGMESVDQFLYFLSSRWTYDLEQPFRAAGWGDQEFMAGDSLKPDFLSWVQSHSWASMADVSAWSERAATTRNVASMREQLYQAQQRLAATREQLYGPTPGGSLTPAIGNGVVRTPNPAEGIAVCDGTVLTVGEYEALFIVAAGAQCENGPTTLDVMPGDPVRWRPTSPDALDFSPTARNNRDQFELAPGIQYRHSEISEHQIADVTGVVEVPAELWEFQSRGQPLMRYGAIYRGRTFWLSDDGKTYHARRMVSDAERNTGIFNALLGAFVAGFALGPIAGKIGAAVMGAEAAAAYPAVANAIGQAAITTARSGGDVELGVKNALLSMVAAQAGGYVGSAVDMLGGPEFLGEVAGVATRVAIVGGDPEQAVIAYALQTGVSAIAAEVRIADVFEPPTYDPPEYTTSGDIPAQLIADLYVPPAYDPPEYTTSGDIPMPSIDHIDFSAPADTLVPGSDWMFPDSGNSAFYPGAFPIATDYGFGPYTEEFGFGAYIDEPPTQFGSGATPNFDILQPMETAPLLDYQPQPYVFGGVASPGYQQPAPDVGGGSAGGGLLSTVTDLALAAIRINAAYQASQAPPPRTATTAPGVIRRPNPNGTLTATNTLTGQTQTVMPERGVPYVLADGRVIINNGNGTYTITRADGSSETLPYTSSGLSQSGSALPWLLGAGALFLIAK